MRGCVGIQIFFAVFIVYMIRVTISINMLAMVKTGKKDTKNNTSECIEKKDENDTESSKPLPDVSIGNWKN